MLADHQEGVDRSKASSKRAASRASSTAPSTSSAATTRPRKTSKYIRVLVPMDIDVRTSKGLSNMVSSLQRMSMRASEKTSKAIAGKGTLPRDDSDITIYANSQSGMSEESKKEGDDKGGKDDDNED